MIAIVFVGTSDKIIQKIKYRIKGTCEYIPKYVN